jgi:LPS-assembly protein
MPAFSRFTFPLTLPRAPKAVGALGALWVSQALMAQAPLPETATGTAAGLKLEMSERLVEQLPATAQSAAPSFVFGERIEGVTSQRTVVEGQAELRRHDLVMRADRIEHLTATGTATATGRVRINRMGDVIEGTSLQLQLDTFVGVLEQPRFSFLSTGGQGQASRLEFQSRDRMTARNVSYTTCQRPSGDNSEPDWQISASQIEFDQTEDTGTALNSVMRFKGVPLLASPWVSFPLSDRRKSGLLPPTFNIDNRSGTELTLPYYLNLAPNRDATLYPTLMTRRGIDLGGEFRYLEPGFNGRLRAAYMPSDRLRDNERWGASVQHQHRFDGLAATGPLGLRLNLNRVSDDDYWRDFPRSSTSLTERLLPNDWVFSGGRGHWSYSAGDYRWQTLQDLDPLSQIVAPYNRVPSLAVAYQPPSFEWAGTQGWATRLLTEFTQFEKPADALRTASDVNGARTLLVASLEKPGKHPAATSRPACSCTPGSTGSTAP